MTVNVPSAERAPSEGGTAEAAPNDKGAAAAPAEPRKTKALVIEKDAGQRLVLKALLTKEGIICDAFANAQEAMEKLRQDAFDMIFITAAMPGPMSGWDMVEKIRHMEEDDGSGRGKLPVIGVVTAQDKDNPRNQASGFSDIIVKPLSQSIVQNIVGKLTASRPRGPPRAAYGAQRTGSTAATTPKGLKSTPGHKIRILIVEDHWANRKLLEAMLLQKGHDLDFVENGLEAVNITGVVDFDLILMDCNMPVMDGWQATEKIRQRDTLNHATPIIAVTANAMKGDRDKCIAAGMDDYISKPVDRKKLYEIIAKWTHAVQDGKGTTITTVPSSHSLPGGGMGEVNGRAAESAGGGGSREGDREKKGAPQPKAVVAAPQKEAPKRSRVNKSQAPEGTKPRILLVDDDDTLRLLVKSRLEKDQSIVIAAADGEEALAKFKANRPDIVISDVFMPKMDGFELCRQIRKIDHTVPIVMLTSMNDVKDRIKGLDAGADDYIVKPFAPKELEARVRSLLRRSEADRGVGDRKSVV